MLCDFLVGFVRRCFVWGFMGYVAGFVGLFVVVVFGVYLILFLSVGVFSYYFVFIWVGLLVMFGFDS